jgi:hypothetical protein
MPRVSLVCSLHAEKGLVTVSALHAILERILPEVIFLEIPAAAYHDYVITVSHNSLESNAVRRYREDHEVNLMPVDLPKPPDEFFANYQELVGKISRTSPDYRRLVDLNSELAATSGFAYLNSKDCSDLWSAIYKEMLDTIKYIGDPALTQPYELWNETIDRRDREMVQNIWRYCQNNIFNRGVFLVGAAHRHSIIEKANDAALANSTRIDWDLSCGGTEQS